MLTQDQFRTILTGILDLTARNHDGSLEFSEEALVQIQSEARKALLDLGILALDPEVEEAECVCGFDFFEAEVEVQPGCKCRKCGRQVHFIGG